MKTHTLATDCRCKACGALLAKLDRDGLPREATDKFLAKFGVQRIKDLPASQVEKARAFVEQLQTESAAPAAAETEIDPFA